MGNLKIASCIISLSNHKTEYHAYTVINTWACCTTNFPSMDWLSYLLLWYLCYRKKIEFNMVSRLADFSKPLSIYTSTPNYLFATFHASLSKFRKILRNMDRWLALKSWSTVFFNCSNVSPKKKSSELFQVLFKVKVFLRCNFLWRHLSKALWRRYIL